MGIQASKHNIAQLHIYNHLYGGWNWMTSASSACRFGGLLRYLGASAEYSASGSRRERWWGNPVLDGARRGAGNLTETGHEVSKFSKSQKGSERTQCSCWYLMISDDIDLHWNANIRISFKHVQTISISAWSHDWTQSFNKWRLRRLGKSWDLKKQCPATRMHTFPRAKPLLFLSQFQAEIKATPPKGHGFLILETAFKFDLWILWQDPVHFKFDFMVMNRPFPWNLQNEKVLPPLADLMGAQTLKSSGGNQNLYIHIIHKPHKHCSMNKAPWCALPSLKIISMARVGTLSTPTKRCTWTDLPAK